MDDKKLLRTGIIGAGIAAICCFTPILVLLVAGVGLSAIVGWLDYALFPALFVFLGITAYALYLRAGRVGPPPKAIIAVAVVLLSALIIWLEFRFALRIAVAAGLVVVGYGFYLERLSGRQTSASG